MRDWAADILLALDVALAIIVCGGILKLFLG